MTPQEFIRKWKPAALTERASAQEHFLDLCRVFEHPTPAEDDPTGERFTFEKGAPKTGGGGDGWWRRRLGRCLEKWLRVALNLERAHG